VSDLNVQAVEEGVSAILTLAGESADVVDVVEAEIIALVQWIGDEIAGGRDPGAMLNALRTSAEVQAKALEAAELGGVTP
jgi:hypothetical protein